MERGVKFGTCNFKSLCGSGPLTRGARKLTYYKLRFYTSSAPLTFSDIDVCNFTMVCSFSVIPLPPTTHRKLWRACYGSLLGSFMALQNRDYWLHHVCPSVWNNLTPTGRILLDIWQLFENLSTKFKFDYNPTIIQDTLCEYLCTFMTIFPWILPRMINIIDKSCRENWSIHFIFNKYIPKIVPFMR